MPDEGGLQDVGAQRHVGEREPSILVGGGADDPGRVGPAVQGHGGVLQRCVALLVGDDAGDRALGGRLGMDPSGLKEKQDHEGQAANHSNCLRTEPRSSVQPEDESRVPLREQGPRLARGARSGSV